MYQIAHSNNSTTLLARLTLPESDVERCRAAVRQNLVTAIRRVVEARKMSHSEASFEARVGRTVITAILNDNLEKISTDRLIRIVHRLGLRVEVKVI
jgi:predicted XRE-type DNA-binding protein